MRAWFWILLVLNIFFAALNFGFFLFGSGEILSFAVGTFNTFVAALALVYVWNQVKRVY